MLFNSNNDSPLENAKLDFETWYLKEDSNDEFEVILGRGIEIEFTWKVGFVMVVIPGTNFIQKSISVDPS